MSKAKEVLNQLHELEELSNELRIAFNKPVFEIALKDFTKICLDLLSDQEIALGGGLALSIYSNPRLTQDVDLFIHAKDLDSIKSILLNNNFKELEHYQFGHMNIFKFKYEDRELDLLYSSDTKFNNFLYDTAVSSPDYKSKVLSVEGLILTKLTKRLKDAADIESIISHGNKIDKGIIKQWASELKLMNRIPDELS